MKWGATEFWGTESFWGLEVGPGPDKYCALADEHVLQQMGLETTNRDFRELICIYMDAKGIFEDTMVDVANAFDITTAVGDQQDKLGSIVGHVRQGFSDARYREFLDIQVSLILSASRDSANWTGTNNNILEICRTFVGAGPAITLLNTPPYAFTLSVPGLVVGEIDQLMVFL